MQNALETSHAQRSLGDDVRLFATSQLAQLWYLQSNLNQRLQHLLQQQTATRFLVDRQRVSYDKIKLTREKHSLCVRDKLRHLLTIGLRVTVNS